MMMIIIITTTIRIIFQCLNFTRTQEIDSGNLLINCLLQNLYTGRAFVYDPAVDFYTH